MMQEHRRRGRLPGPGGLFRWMAVVFISLFFLVSGCSESSLTFQVRFPEVSGLKQSDPVYFRNNRIGEVTRIFYTKQGDYLVDVEIAPEFKNTATEDSRFYIEHSLRSELETGLVVEQDRSGGVVLRNGAVVLGSVRNGSWAELLNDLQEKAGAVQNELNKLLKELTKSLDTASKELDRELAATLEALFLQFNAFGDDLKKLPDSEELKQLEEGLKQFAEEFQKVQKDVQDRLRREIIPLLQKELERLRNEFKKEGREEELEPIDKQIEELYTV